MKFENVVIIEKVGEVGISEKNLYAGPCRMADIERFEEGLERAGVDYTLAQVETIVDREDVKGKALRYIKGYCLFVKGGAFITAAVYNREEEAQSRSTAVAEFGSMVGHGSIGHAAALYFKPTEFNERFLDMEEHDE